MTFRTATVSFAKWPAVALVLASSAWGCQQNGALADRRAAAVAIANLAAIRAGFNEDIEAKIAKHTELFRSNEINFFCEWFNYKFNRFRLLYITNSPSRMESISQVVKTYDKWGFILLTTLKKFEKYGIDKNIWNVPALNQCDISII